MYWACVAEWVIMCWICSYADRELNENMQWVIDRASGRHVLSGLSMRAAGVFTG